MYIRNMRSSLRYASKNCINRPLKEGLSIEVLSFVESLIFKLQHVLGFGGKKNISIIICKSTHRRRNFNYRFEVRHKKIKRKKKRKSNLKTMRSTA